MSQANLVIFLRCSRVAATVILLLTFSTLFFLSACPRKAPSEAMQSPPNAPQPPTAKTRDDVGKRPVRLYFYDPQATLLVPITRRVQKEAPYPQIVFDELVRGPVEGEKLEPTIPAGTKLLGSSSKDGVLTLDWSKGITSYGGGSAWEMGVFLSVMYTARQVEGVSSVKWLIDGKTVDYLPEGTGIREPVPIPLWENDYDPGPEKDKITAYLVLRNTDLLVPTTISALSPKELSDKLADKKTYGGVFEAGVCGISFSLWVTKEGRIHLSLDKSLLDLPKDKQSAIIRSLACTVYNYVESRPEYIGMSVSYDGSNVVTLLDVDVTAEGCADWLANINSEGA